MRGPEHTVQVVRVLFVDEVSQVTTIVENQVEWLSIRKSSKSLLNAPEILLLGLAFPCVNRNTSGRDGSSGMVLGGKDVLRW